MSEITIERTGRIFSFAGSEFLAIYPDGHVGNIWSPPWHEMEPDEEEMVALAEARRWFLEGSHRQPHGQEEVA